jgi:pyrimidine-nucleoside phosphorylase
MPVPLAPLEVLERARRGGHVDPDSLRGFVRTWLGNSATDAQMAALCMVVATRGLDRDGVRAVTSALIASGDRLDLSPLGATGDAHSTGAVGDAASLVVPPLAASLGLRMAVMGDRGRGHLGGLVDKLESIPGYRAQLDLREFVLQVRDTGCAVISQTARLAPGEERLAVLREQTATMEVHELVAASVMARALAGGAGTIVVDATCGVGAPFPDADAAARTAELMAWLAEPWDRTLRWVVTPMDAPRGRMIGNAMEVREAGEVLRGGGPAATREVAATMAGELAEAAGLVPPGEGRAAAARALADGAALAAAERWVEAQHGDPEVWTNPAALPEAPLKIEVVSPADGVLAAMSARVVGEAVRGLGAGRLHPAQRVDTAVGVELLAGIGDPVVRGEPVAIVHARDQWLGERCGGAIQECLLVSGTAEAAPAVLRRDGATPHA